MYEIVYRYYVLYDIFIILRKIRFIFYIILMFFKIVGVYKVCYKILIFFGVIVLKKVFNIELLEIENCRDI